MVMVESNKLITKSYIGRLRESETLTLITLNAVSPIHITANNTAIDPLKKVTSKNGRMFTNRADWSHDLAQPIRLLPVCH